MRNGNEIQKERWIATATLNCLVQYNNEINIPIFLRLQFFFSLTIYMRIVFSEII